MNIRRLLPTRLRRQNRVIAIQCSLCGLWRKPRHVSLPAVVCRDCETTDVFQSWKRATPIVRLSPHGGVR